MASLKQQFERLNKRLTKLGLYGQFYGDSMNEGLLYGGLETFTGDDEEKHEQAQQWLINEDFSDKEFAKWAIAMGWDFVEAMGEM
jgi:hypothetical protein